MNFGPIQLIAFAFDSVDKFKGQIRRELDDLRGRGLIRVIDLLFIIKAVDGTVHSLQASDLLEHEAAEFGALLSRMLAIGAADEESAYLGELLGGVMPTARGQGMSLADIQAAAAGIPPGKAAALLLFEHTWAIGLGEAILGADGHMVAQGFITRDALLAVGRELSAIVEAEGAIERAAAIRGAAMLDALTTVAAEEPQYAPGDEAFRSMAAAEAVRALVVAGLLDETAAPDAIDALVRAGLISSAALQEAGRA
ncbi:MAG: hypothetical protein HGA45_29035, partial [Chloroflexales bacterium]|nr:hypothetical protein [Chloroflexales bacterium]